MTAGRPGSARGLSYLELLLVVAMMSVLTALVLPTATHIHRRTQERQLKRGLATMRAAIDSYHKDWERGCIESDDEKGWPKDLEELHEGVTWSDTPECNPEKSKDDARGGDPSAPGRLIHDLPVRRTPGARSSSGGGGQDQEKHVYLRHVPADPFNVEKDEWDTMGWKARSYDDEPDASSWKGEGLYDVYSSSELAAINGTKYAQW